MSEMWMLAFVLIMQKPDPQSSLEFGWPIAVHVERPRPSVTWLDEPKDFIGVTITCPDHWFLDAIPMDLWDTDIPNTKQKMDAAIGQMRCRRPDKFGKEDEAMKYKHDILAKAGEYRDLKVTVKAEQKERQ